MSRHIDFIQPFMIDDASVRGRFVRLGPVIDEILTKHSYPTPVCYTLAHFLVLSACLSNTFKFDGIFTLQIRGSGLLKMVVADIESNGNMRGYAQYDESNVEALEIAFEEHNGHIGLCDLFGSGQLVFTVDPGNGREMFQGIVPLEGDDLDECFKFYFLNSDQIQVDFKAVIEHAVSDDGERMWQTAAMMLQKMPPAKGQSDEDADDAWARSKMFMKTATKDEMLNSFLPSHDLIFKLFNEDGARIYDPTPLQAQCRCSREKFEGILKGMGESDMNHMVEDGKITATCQFCSEKYVFDEADLSNMQNE